VSFHSKTGGSATERFLNCPGSVSLIKGAGLDTESDEPDYRVDGTIAHEVASECLRRGLDAWEFIIPELRRFKAEHAEAVQQYINFVLNRFAELRARFTNVEMEVEQHVTHPDEPDFYGTVDTFFVCDGVYVEVIDYKHGVGISVDVKRNGQLMYYAHGLQVRYPNIRAFNLVIVQPRGFHREGPIREWTISGADLKQWAEKVLLPGIKKAQKGGGKLIPGGWCTFCPVKVFCPVLTGMAKAAATADKDVLPTLNNEQLGREFELIDVVEKYLKAIYNEVSRRAMLGQEGPWKVVKKKAFRQWVPGYQAPMMSVPMSPAQAELRLANGKELAKEFSMIPEDGGTTVVALSDSRPAITRSAIDFEGLTDDTE
jgi:hypothetical protein